MKDGKPLILCVDDDADIRDTLAVILEAHGYASVLAETAEEGLRSFHEHHPDLVIVDLMMESVDAGTNFVKELRLAGHVVPIFMLSSVGDSLNQIADYGDLGLAGVLQKPINPDALIALLEARLS